ncbi:hypothetical protein P6166_10095 [Stenotrophomonas sp. HITSZ_GD]|uniref:hypothetical protein n=1 Tax=Stenotrophomonas sp. HITSZ_GD TaxID=3037248 RepID=UPI00240E4939|nr:hypothetical protein [Stenotrophomonas sp. HITSZ_GD]MDG2525704.1 hypothetical protein [Stenotrophomonas sp. HITSZ_GD]
MAKAFRMFYALLALGIGMPTLLLAAAALPVGITLGPVMLAVALGKLFTGQLDGEAWFVGGYVCGAYAGMVAWVALSVPYLRGRRAAFHATRPWLWWLLAAGAVAAAMLWWAAPYKTWSLLFAGPGMLLPMLQLALARLLDRPVAPPPLACPAGYSI